MNSLFLKIKFLFGILISIIFLILVLKKIDIHAVWTVFKSIQLIYLIPLLLILPGFYVFFAWRWKSIFSNFKKKPTLTNLLKSSILGYMGNNILPARLGELLRLYFLKKRSHIPMTYTLATIALEKTFDGLAIMSFFMLVLLSLAITNTYLSIDEITYVQLKFFGYLITSIYLCAIMLLFLFRQQIKFFLALHKNFFSSFSKKIGKRISKFLLIFAQGLSSFKKFKDIFRIYIYSLFVWDVHALIIFFCLKACGIHLPFLGSFFILAFIGFACMIPSSPGFIGTLEFFIILSLAYFGIEKEQALAFALVYRIVEMLPVVVAGIYLFIKETISLKEVRKDDYELQIKNYEE